MTAVERGVRIGNVAGASVCSPDTRVKVRPPLGLNPAGGACLYPRPIMFADPAGTHMLSGRMIELAGVRVRREVVLELAEDLLRSGTEATARLLLNAVQMGKSTVWLTVDQREEILAELNDPAPGLEELRGVLLAEHEGRGREGLA